MSVLSKLRESSQKAVARTGDGETPGEGRAIAAYLGRAPAPSLEPGSHAIDEHVVDEYGRDHHDRLILAVTA